MERRGGREGEREWVRKGEFGDLDNLKDAVEGAADRALHAECGPAVHVDLATLILKKEKDGQAGEIFALT